MNLRAAKELSPREFHARRAEERRTRREELRQRKLADVRAAIHRIAPQHPAVRSVHLFGSILHPGRFDAQSDVDVAIECDDLEAETPFARALENELKTPIDLRPLAGAIAEAVQEHGEKVYG